MDSAGHAAATAVSTVLWTLAVLGLTALGVINSPWLMLAILGGSSLCLAAFYLMGGRLR